MIELKEREKKLLIALILLVCCLILYFFLIRPIWNYTAAIEKKYEVNQADLNKLDKIYQKYKVTKDKRTRFLSLLNKSRGITTIIEENARSVNILRNNVYTRDRPSNFQGKYKKTSTDVKFEGVDITSILKFIYQIENSNKLIKTSYLRISRGLKGKNTYDVILKFDSLSSQ